MSETFDVIIVGGGVMGLSAALHLRLMGVPRVLVVERHGIGSGQSGRAAGIVRALVRNPDVSGWLIESQRFLTEFEARFQVPIAINTAGYLLISQASEREQVESSLTLSGRAGCRASMISAEEAQRLQRGLARDGDFCFAFEPSAIHVDPMVVTQALAQVVSNLGVQILEGCEVSTVSTCGDSVTGVETSTERFSAPAVLIVTAAWGQAQLQGLGIEIPVYPHRAEMAFFHAPMGRGERLCRIVSDTTSMLYMRPEGAEQMFVGWREGDRICGTQGLVPEDPDDYRQTSHYASLRRMQDGLAGLLSFMRDGFVHRTYACVYDYTPDAMPILDRAPGIEGLYFALGFSGGGFSISPWVGRLMAQFIKDGSKPEEVELLSLDRFSSGRLIDWSNIKPADNQPAPSQ